MLSGERKNVKGDGSRSGKDFGYLRLGDVYYSLPPPTASINTSNLHTTALSSARTLTNSTITLSPREIFTLVYTRLSALSLLDINLAAQEARVLGDTGSGFYYESVVTDGDGDDGEEEEEEEGSGKEGREGEGEEEGRFGEEGRGRDDDYGFSSEKSERRKPRRRRRKNILPWPLRLLAIRLQSIAYKDPKAGILGYYDLAREARLRIKEIQDLRPGISKPDNDSTRGSEEKDGNGNGNGDGDEDEVDEVGNKNGEALNDEEEIIWQNRLKELNIWVVNALIETGDYTTARRILEEDRLRIGRSSMRKKKGKPITTKEKSGEKSGKSEEEEKRQHGQVSQEDEGGVGMEEEERLIIARLALLCYQMGDTNAFSRYLSLLRAPSLEAASSASSSSSSPKRSSTLPPAQPSTSQLSDPSPSSPASSGPLKYDPLLLLSLLPFTQDPSPTTPTQLQSPLSTPLPTNSQYHRTLLINNHAISLLYGGKISEAMKVLEGLVREGKEGEEGKGRGRMGSKGNMGDMGGMKRMEGVRFNLGKMGELMGRG